MIETQYDRKMNKISSYEKFLTRAQIKFKDKFEFIGFTKFDDKFTFKCKKCSVLGTGTPANFLRTKEPCFECRRLMVEQNFLSKISLNVQNCYVKNSIIAGRRPTAEFICSKCSCSFRRKINDINSTVTCTKCYFNHIKFSSLQERGDNIFGSQKYCYKQSVYVHSMKHMRIMCLSCDKEFFVTPNNHFNLGSGCPVCAHGRISKKSTIWLDKIQIPSNYHEKWLTLEGKHLRVDAFHEGVVYEFLGRYWHGDPRYINGDTFIPTLSKTAKQVYTETIERFALLKRNGYQVKFVWEIDFDKGELFSVQL